MYGAESVILNLARGLKTAGILASSAFSPTR